MYLSRVEIDTKNRQKIKDLDNLAKYHNWVERSFDEKYSKIRPRHLWRIDQIGNHQYLLVLSEEKPNLNKLEKYGVSKTAETKDYDHYLNNIKEGSKWRFKLTANPTHRINDGNKSRIVPHITIQQQLYWLLDRSEKNGFRIIRNDDQARIKAIHLKKPIISVDTTKFISDESYQMNITNRDWPVLEKNSRRMKISRVTFEGFLKVTDLDKFRNVLTKGIGREKAYGMGLLTVIPSAD